MKSRIHLLAVLAPFVEAQEWVVNISNFTLDRHEAFPHIRNISFTLDGYKASGVFCGLDLPSSFPTTVFRCESTGAEPTKYRFSVGYYCPVTAVDYAVGLTHYEDSERLEFHGFSLIPTESHLTDPETGKFVCAQIEPVVMELAESP